MRLRVTVRRHGLPDTPIIWVIDTSAAPTVSQLLEQINDIIPIETDGEWGLDDYAVELKGANGVNYECLHFQPVAGVMKEEDEVLIRPLLSQDIKIRRISGRRQISSAGAHLVDGVVFGRPLLRLADRPAVNIPPRKKRRITYEGEDNADEAQGALEDCEAENTEDGGDRQLVLHADFDDGDSDEDEDEDFSPGDDDDDDYDEDDADLAARDSDEGSDEEEQKSDLEMGEDSNHEVFEHEVVEKSLKDVKDAAVRANIRKLQAAFPKSKLGLCKHVLKGTHNNMGEAYEAMLLGFDAVLPKSAFTEIPQGHTALSIPKTRLKALNASTEHSEVLDSSMQVEPDESPNPLIDYYDQNGLPPGSIASGKALSFMADVLKRSPTRGRPGSRSSAASNRSVRFALSKDDSSAPASSPIIDKESRKSESSEDDSDDSSEEDSSSEDDSSEASSDDSSSGDDEEENSPQQPGSSSSDSGSDDDSSSDSSSDEEAPEEKSSKASKVNPVQSSLIDAEISKPKQKQPLVPPGQGKSATRLRNERRRKNNAMNRYKEKGILPAGTTIAEFDQLNKDQLQSHEDASAALENLRATRSSAESKKSSAKSISDTENFEQRRQMLLASISAGGVEVGTESASMSSKQVSPAHENHTTEDKLEKNVYQPLVSKGLAEASPSERAIIESTSTEVKLMKVDQISKSVTPLSVAKAASGMVGTSSSKADASPADFAPSSAGPRRAKLDLSAGRRMLFGALGMRNPKTKKDEEKLRNDLMKDTRPLIIAKPVEEKPAIELAIDEDPDAWKEKITYRAVECAQEDVELSEPPFPFQQRWDPQQRHERGGKRKDRDQSQYYDDSRTSKKQKRRKGKHDYIEERNYALESLQLSYDDSYELQYDDSTQISRPEVHDRESVIIQQLEDDIQDSAEATSQNPDDLAPLPEDPTSLPNMAEGAAKVGMTVAFKCLEMSEATKWQPKISPYRTAIVISISGNGELQLSLAMRDRKPGKAYDEETGERIYGKFEMPDDDDEMDGEDDGILNLSFGELLEPKIVQEPPNGSSDMETEDKDTSQPNELPKGNASVALSNEDGLTEIQFSQVDGQFSHVTETPLNSEVLEQLDFVEMEEVEVGDQNEQAAQKDTIGVPMTFLDAKDERTYPVTPNLKTRDILSADILTPSLQISEENRKNISTLMKDAGFRSSIPSSIMRGIGPKTPGDTHAFEKLMQDMSDTPQNPPYSPKFNGFEASPLKNVAVGVPQDQIESMPDVGESSQQLPSAEEKLRQSSWETVDPQLGSPAPLTPPSGQKQTTVSVDVHHEEARDEEEYFGSPTPEPIKIPGRRKVPVSKAQEIWEQFQPKNRRISQESYVESEEISQNTSISLGGSIENESITSIQYPKLSVASSSFTSQIADHGRQPDFEFDDSALLNAEPSKISTMSTSKSLDLRSIDPDTTSNEPVSKTIEKIALRDPFSDSEPGLPAQKPINGRARCTSRITKVQELVSSSDDFFPTLEVLSQQSQAIKKENVSWAGLPIKKTVESSKNKHSTRLDHEISDEEITPKASRKQRGSSQKPVSKSKDPEKPSFQRRKTAPSASQPMRSYQLLASQTRASQSQPPQSQPYPNQNRPPGVVDLTFSSDVEGFEPELKVPKRFQNYDMDNEEDDDFEGTPGWVAKKTTTIAGLRSGRRQKAVEMGVGVVQMEMEMKDPSQVGLNERRRTSSREVRGRKLGVERA